MSWKLKKLKVKQPVIEEKEDTMSRHMDAVATSACKEKIVQFHREEVATTSGCRENNCTEKRSRQHHDVATTIVQNGSHDNIRLSRHHLQGLEGRDVSKLSRRQFH